MWRCCLNPKVLAGLAVVGAALWFLSPAPIGAVLPTLLLLACPLSMGAMMWRMRSGANCSAAGPGSGGATDADARPRSGCSEAVSDAAAGRTSPAHALSSKPTSPR